MFIIFGWNHEIRTNYGPVEEIICTNCTIKDYWILEKSKVYFTLFFIPIFSYKTNLEYYCPRCKECVQLDETTFFANEGLQRYSLPKLNLAQEKEAIQQQYFLAVGNRESAAYKLQKETPIIKILDNPEPPYDKEQKSKMIYTAIGLILGTIVAMLLVNWKIMMSYIRKQFN